MTKYTTAGLHTKVGNALREFFREDKELLRIDANERSITHKLAEHLQRQFCDLKVDCEYNRHCDDPKKLYCNCDPKTSRCHPNTTETDSLHATTIYPDIVVHERGFDDSNALVIEVKKSNRDDADHDKYKLSKLTVPRNKNEPEDKLKYGYNLGLFLEFCVGKQKGLNRAECFENGTKTPNCCCCDRLLEICGSQP